MLEVHHSASAAIPPVFPLEQADETLPAGLEPRTAMPLEKLTLHVVAAFRNHPHIGNVLTHIAGGQWSRIEIALRTIFDPGKGSTALSPLERNIVDLMCADRGVTGRILKPYYQELFASLLGVQPTVRLIAHITRLFLECEMRDKNAAASTNPTEAEAGPP